MAQTAHVDSAPEVADSAGPDGTILRDLERQLADEVVFLRSMRSSSSPDEVRARTSSRLIQAIKARADLIRMRLDIAKHVATLSRLQLQAVLEVLVEALDAAAKKSGISDAQLKALLLVLSDREEVIEDGINRAVNSAAEAP